MIPAESGELASGLSGEGRMAEPENIIAFLEADLESKLPLKGKKILITAGPTYEAIDPVRFIGNHSSGKMGFDIAQSAANLGATVVLVSGPSHFNINHPAVAGKYHDLFSGEAVEMQRAASFNFKAGEYVVYHSTH